MATMWYSKDGRRPHTQRGPGTDLSHDEIRAIFGREQLLYIGTEAPSINPGSPSYSDKNVIIEIGDNDRFSELLPKVGFYLVVGVRPADAESKLQAHRTAD